jgi:hypothetical protein
MTVPSWLCGTCGHDRGMHDGLGCSFWLLAASEVHDCPCREFVPLSEAVRA